MNAIKFFLASTTLVLLQPVVASAQVQEAWAVHYATTRDSWRVGMAIDPADNICTAAGNVIMKHDAGGNQLWVAHFEDHAPWVATGLAVDGAGNLHVAGFSTGADGTADFATVKYDPHGNLLWVARYSGPPITFGSHDLPAGIAVDQAGNVYVTGKSGNHSLPAWTYVVIKHDANGNTLWVQSYRGPGHAHEPAALALDRDGNIYVTGSSSGQSSFPDYATLKYSPDGLLLWEARYDADRDFDLAQALAVDEAGNVYVTGYSYSGGTGDYATVKYDTHGNQRWVARYRGPGNSSRPAQIAIDPAGNVIVTGSSRGTNHWDDLATVKYDAQGNQLWVARYDGPAQYWDYASDLVVDDHGNVYVTGDISVECFFDPAEDDFVCTTDLITLKYAPDGAELWSIRYNGPGNWHNRGSVLALDGSGDVLVSGSSAGPERSAGLAIIKYRQRGAPTPCDRVASLTEYIRNSPLPDRLQRPLMSSLRNACQSFASDDHVTGANLLRAFQRKVRAQITRVDDRLASDFIQRAEDILDALRP